MDAAIKGRGTAQNPPNRFERLHYTPGDDDQGLADEDQVAPTTHFYADAARSVVSYNNSPDVGFDASVNPYRGCEHGCVYCYARPTHEYFGLSLGLDFETRIMVKTAAPALLRAELMAPAWVPQVLAFSGVTDCYQPIERRLQLTRGCLDVLAEFRNPVSIITKNHLVVRDIDVFLRLAAFDGVIVNVSVTSLDDHLAGVLEPRASRPRRRLEAIQRLAAAGLPVGVMVAPIIPGLNDDEVPGILQAARAAGARWAHYVMLRLPHGLGPLFEGWLSQHFPGRKDKVLNRVRALRDGKLNDSRFGHRMRGSGIWAEQIDTLFRITHRRLQYEDAPAVSAHAFQRPGPSQLTLF